MLKRKLEGLRQQNKDFKRELDTVRSRDDVGESLHIVGEHSMIGDDDIGDFSDGKENSPPHVRAGAPTSTYLSNVVTRPTLQRVSLARYPRTSIRDDDDDDGDVHPMPYKSDWNLPSKKRKLGEGDGTSRVATASKVLPFPLNIDRTGHVKGTVHLGTRVRMTK